VLSGGQKRSLTISNIIEAQREHACDCLAYPDANRENTTFVWNMASYKCYYGTNTLAHGLAKASLNAAQTARCAFIASSTTGIMPKKP